ncbi:pyrimidine dimer DNA glycosylase /DNA-(apurinic or apyrimidinic site) lyase [Microbacterium album]|uniref:Pyrimidine dimer DNA glycosylase /DNA-(Apurinic or apyrimidinic site) lyase n=1 Tax=Microbacterium album TaxID=2053191 RepID=A0A917MMX4_9MICO|nr:pyrimidine dimer DNA glycosylase /DNA-(apurinic or apyrimidinic site) lyase [Microbacterium album]
MRLWSLHPGLLDRQGLTACWREALLAQAVLGGGTRGYTAHPQLVRFREHADPLAAVGAYLAGVREEALRRGYRFDATRIVRMPGTPVARIPLPSGQLEFEWRHLQDKLAARAPEVHARNRRHGAPRAHPLFVVVPGPVAAWERAAPPAEPARPEPPRPESPRPESPRPEPPARPESPPARGAA